MSERVRVLMLSWEYPPLVVGGLGRHVDALSRALVAAGHEVCVVTRGAGPDAEEQIRHGVRVCRAAADPVDIGFTTETLLAWSQANEHALLRAALPVVRRWAPDVVHAHDWLVAQSAITLAQVTGAPLVATIHALEAGRHQGWLPAPLNRAIHSVERWLVAEAATVITCSGFMQDEVTRRFDVDPSRIRVVPNGIDTGQWATTSASREAARAPYGPAPLVVFAGRLVHEKGLQTLVAALPALRRAHPGLHLVVAGTGPLEAELRARARSLRVARMISWAGFLGEDALLRLLAAADLAVVPSFYEPFGLVALEAAAAGTPLVVADTGGLRDLVVDGVTGARFPSGDPGALAQVISRTLAEPARARGLANRARRRAREQFSWPAVASRTAVVYEQAAPKLGIVASS